MTYNHKEYMKKWNDKNRDNQKEKRNINKEKIKIRDIEYRKNNPETWKKTYTISQWKKNGLLGDYQLIYKIYLSTKFCDECGFELTYDRFPTKTRKAMDHCHKSGLFRNILCHKCNTKRRY